MFKKIFGGKSSSDDVDTSHYTWITRARKVRKRDLVPFLREAPLVGREYLLVADNRVQGVYNQSTNLDTLNLVFGNYVVYEIDKKAIPIREVIEPVTTADPLTTVSVVIELDIKITNSRELFETNLGDLKVYVMREIRRKAIQVCQIFRPSDYTKAQQELELQLMKINFKNGIEIDHPLVQVHLPESVQTAIRANAEKFDSELNVWMRGRIDFTMKVEFHQATYAYELKAIIIIALEEPHTRAREKMKADGITNPEGEIKERALPIIRNAIRENRTEVHVAEEVARSRVKKMNIDFGVRIENVYVEILSTSEEKLDMRIEQDRKLLQRVYSLGLTGLRMEMMVNPTFKERIKEFIQIMKDDREYVEQAQLEWVRNRLHLMSDTIGIDVDIARDNTADQLTQIVQGLFFDESNISLLNNGDRVISNREANAQNDMSITMPKKELSTYDNIPTSNNDNE